PIVEHELAFGPENLKLPREEIRARIENTLLLLDISRLRDHETSTLSFGQKKIVALAALLTLSPQIYLLDEPGAGLSSDNIKKVKEIILNLARESRIVFIADHNSEILEISNRTINLGKKNHVCN
ncbi:MAG: ATP-binding cassette domain-containing protein, partial [Candidatus Cloacimonetes bacterium]|nr:ATP-binding cassette domain-containing protein [Candidatus Cloacimonadota bacterium]